MGAPIWPSYLKAGGFVAVGAAMFADAWYAMNGARQPNMLGRTPPSRLPLDDKTRIEQALARVFAEAEAAGKGIGPRGLVAKMADLDPIGQRVGLIRELVRRYSGTTTDKKYAGISAAFKELATTIVTEKNGDGSWKTPEKDWPAEARALFDWTRANVRYVRDPRYRDWFSAPDRTLATRGGDCDDLGTVLGVLLTSLSFPVRLRVIQTDRSRDYDHIYLVADVSGDSGRPNWIALDASVAQPAGWEAPGAAAVVAQGARDAAGAMVAPGGMALGRVVRVKDFEV